MSPDVRSVGRAKSHTVDMVIHLCPTPRTITHAPHKHASVHNLWELSLSSARQAPLNLGWSSQPLCMQALILHVEHGLAQGLSACSQVMQYSVLLLEAPGGSLWDTKSWTRGAFGMIQWGCSYVLTPFAIPHWFLYLGYRSKLLDITENMSSRQITSLRSP